MAYVVDRVVICDAFREPERHYQLLAGGRSKLATGRRPSMRLLASARDVKGGIAGVVGKEASLFDDFLASSEQRNDFVNQLRDDVRAWREAGYPGTAVVTRRLLEWWFERDEERAKLYKRFFFCQQEAVETVIYLYMEEGLRRVGQHVRDDARSEPGAPMRGRQRPACGVALRAPDARVRAAAQPRRRGTQALGDDPDRLQGIRRRQGQRGGAARDGQHRRVQGKVRRTGAVHCERGERIETMEAGGVRSDPRDIGILYWRGQALDILENAIRGSGLPGVEAVPILGSPEWLDSAHLRRFQWTGVVADGKRCHTNKVPCHTDLEKRFVDFLDSAKDIVFRAKPAGTRQGKIVLAQYRGPADPDTGGAFTVKRYSSEKEADGEGGWRHTSVTLSPRNPEYSPIILSKRDADSVQVLGEFVTVLRST